jgi:hypothetical protein
MTLEEAEYWLPSAAGLQSDESKIVAEINKLSDAEVDAELRALGCDPDAIGRRGVELALELLRRRRERGDR